MHLHRLGKACIYSLITWLWLSVESDSRSYLSLKAHIDVMNSKYEYLAIHPQDANRIHTELRKCKKTVPRNSLDFLKPDFPPENVAVSRATIMVATVACGTFQITVLCICPILPIFSFTILPDRFSTWYFLHNIPTFRSWMIIRGFFLANQDRLRSPLYFLHQQIRQTENSWIWLGSFEALHATPHILFGPKLFEFRNSTKWAVLPRVLEIKFRAFGYTNIDEWNPQPILQGEKLPKETEPIDTRASCHKGFQNWFARDKSS